jgi:hypothetical protein
MARTREGGAVNRAEYLLTVLGEEGSEVAHRVSKALRFGADEVQPGQPDTNGERIRFEVYDVIASYLIAADENDGLPPLHLDADIIAQMKATKRAKIETFMQISREQGTLQP